MTAYDDCTIQAHRDQYLATLRNYAESCGDIMDSFIKAGFTRVESMELVLRHLDRLEGFYEID